MNDKADPDRPSALDEIVAHKRVEVEEAKQRVPLSKLKEQISELGRPRNFFQAVVRKDRPNGVSVIAEIKRKSPSAGWIRPEYEQDDFDPAAIAKRYHEAGASALSVLTDERFFAGSLEYIHRVRDAVPLPVLRKDFIIDPYQVWEARASGADAILLIAECLSISQLVDLEILARELQLTSLIETHSMDNLLRVRPHVGFPSRAYGLLGINNRDLATMTTDISHTTRLADMVEDTSILVSESGIQSPEDIAKLRKVGVRIVLVGESLMRTEDPGAALEALVGVP
ncbi:MAG: indole-3-glycerol phosphate synthase TrpC, partial [Planctomycetota bacterium]